MSQQNWPQQPQQNWQSQQPQQPQQNWQSQPQQQWPSQPQQDWQSQQQQGYPQQPGYPQQQGYPQPYQQPGYPQQPVMVGGVVTTQQKDWLLTLLFCVFLGTLGVHRFYVGKVGTGIAMFFTLGGCWIWWIVDIIAIANGSFRDSNGLPLLKKS